MAFWGVEVKPGKPYVHHYDEERGRLHVSQATLGNGSSSKKSLVQCSVGDGAPVLLCALLPEKVESCSLSLEFEEAEEVTFSVDGPRSVHLTGFYFGADKDDDRDSDDSDSYNEDMEMGHSSECDTEDEEEYEEGFLDEDDDESEDFEMFSHRPNSGVVIEEIHDEEKTVNGETTQKRRPKQKFQNSDSDGKNDSQKQIVLKGATTPVLESEDEDGFPIAPLANEQNGVSRGKVDQVYKKKKNEEKNTDVDVDRVLKSKRKMDAIEQETNLALEPSEQVDSLPQSNRTTAEKEGKAKKKKKQKSTEGKTPEHKEALSVDTLKENVVNENHSDIPSTDKIENTQIGNASNGVEEAADASAEAKITEGKKKKKKSKSNSGDATVGSTKSRELAESEKKPVKKIEDQKSKVQPSKPRTYGNGMVVEELYIGKPDGKRASLGKKVSVRYIGKLKNGKIFDSNISGKPFKFRLGIGEVIKGWDVGVEGMRIGDKRRLTIPPSMGYGSKGVGAIPANSWLIFDVELVDVQ